MYVQHERLEHASYHDQWNTRANSLFGVAHYYSRAFAQLGHQAEEVFANSRPMLTSWAREHGMRPSFWDRFQDFRSSIRNRFHASHQRMQTVIAERIRSTRPDLVLNQDMIAFDSDFFEPLRSDIRYLVGQHACTEVWTERDHNWIPFVKDHQEWSVYDLVVSSMPSSVEWFAQRGCNAKLNRLGIDAEIMRTIQANQSPTEASFVGSLSRVHSSRRELLEDVVASQPISIWTSAKDVHANSPLLPYCRGEVYGRQMLETLKSSAMTLNHHGNVRPHANNMRLYEATGVGTLLITDWKPDLEEIFDPNEEVCAYRSSEECIDLIAKYRRDRTARLQIASRGSKRALSEHRYFNRMQELIHHLDPARGN